MSPTHPEPQVGARPASADPRLSAASKPGGPAGDAGAGMVPAIKPKLRGWIHAGIAPLALTYGIVVTALAPAGVARVTVAIFAAATVLLFVVSAIYHRGTWSPGVFATLRRLDHANIFLVIAGTYTPLTALLLDRTTATILLSIVWTGAVAGILMRVFWLSAPRWLYVPIYIALGWVAIGFIPAFSASGGPAIGVLVLTGGLGYTLGAVVYGLKRPNPSPTWFGFHEIFHIGTVIGYACHAAAIALVALD